MNNSLPHNLDMPIPLGSAPVTISEEDYHNLFEYFPSGLATLSLDGKVIMANTLFKQLTQFRRCKGDQFCLSDTQEEIIVDFEAIKHLLTYDPKDGSYLQLDCNLGDMQDAHWVELHVNLVYNAKQQPLFFIVECRDIQSHRTQINQLRIQSMLDPLTGLGNRKYLEHEFNRAVVVAEQCRNSFALLVIDVDKFKHINDTLGHERGDQVLLAVAHRLRHAVRSSDTVVRLGGDEFVVIVNGLTDYHIVHDIAAKIMIACREPVVLSSGDNLSITLSIGISIYPLTGASYVTLFEKADKALYQVKQAGRNNYVLYLEDS